MQCTLQLLYWKNGTPFREAWELPSISIEQYIPSQHNKTLYEHPDMNLNIPDKILIWRQALPENEEEKKFFDSTAVG